MGEIQLSNCSGFLAQTKIRIIIKIMDGRMDPDLHKVHSHTMLSSSNTKCSSEMHQILHYQKGTINVAGTAVQENVVTMS